MLFFENGASELQRSMKCEQSGFVEVIGPANSMQHIMALSGTALTTMTYVKEEYVAVEGGESYAELSSTSKEV